MSTIDRLLVANRGEIACRIARTTRRMGIETVGVYSEADVGAPHVRACDQAWALGPAPARDSYLRIDRLIDVAKKAKAQAVHPGYGFLSENAEFAEACAAEGLIFVGPPASAIRAMGSKSASKALLLSMGVPLVPGYHGDAQDNATLAREAERIGFPVLVKASAGGGGKGMRVVERRQDLVSAVDGARREAENSFGDGRLLIERYLVRPRHIEIQVFADRHGNVVHLFERDCSIQRRHQKVLEEAPAPGMTAERRQAMGEAAVDVCRAIGYEGAGTVEFIVAADGPFYFMEMNTRLQVEHPVTEMITVLDLVEWQIRVAAGEPLPLRQDQVRAEGHAMEARIYAEDPARDFLPQTGTLRHLRMPAGAPHVRIDAGVEAGSDIGIHYDPMIAKLIVWDRDRISAARRLAQALSQVEIVGVTSNVEFLVRLAGHPSFVAAEVDTGFIVRHRADLLPSPIPVADDDIALATLALALEASRSAECLSETSEDRHSPWFSSRGWRLNDEGYHRYGYRDGDREVWATLHFDAVGYRLELPSSTLWIDGRRDADGRLSATIDGRRVVASLVHDQGAMHVFRRGRRATLTILDPLAMVSMAEGRDGRLTAPMPGKVVQVLVGVGDRVGEGQPMLLLEAMKMEHTVKSPFGGRVAAIHYGPGDQVDEGADLLDLEAEPSS
jgi:3-methylcrotonyl-CoA carboxylase alpha subunit